MGFNLPVLNRLRRVVAPFTPTRLFATSEPGVWYDPSDLTTMFQDTAGTTPVTTPGQTVALLLDKSKGLVLGSELVTNRTFDADTDWTKGAGWTISGGVASKVGGAGRLSQLSASVVAGRTYQAQFTVVSVTVAGSGVGIDVGGTIFGSYTTAGTYTALLVAGASGVFAIQPRGDGSWAGSIDNISIKELPGNHATQATTASRPTYGIVPLGGRRNLLLATDTMATQSLTVTAVAHTLAFTGTGTVTLTGASIAGPLIGTGASNRVSLTFTPTAASLTLTVVGSVTLAQLELGSTATAYQRVGTAFDVTEAGVQSLSYLAFDGVDDFLVTPTITPGIDEVQVFAGVRKLSDAAAGVLLESSTSSSVNAGTFGVLAPSSPTSLRYDFRTQGTVFATASTSNSAFAAPITNVLTGLGDISGDVARLRINGVQTAETLTDQGTGNYLAYPIYIGRRGGTSLPFNGQIYGLIVRFGANLASSQITDAETWTNGKTGAY